MTDRLDAELSVPGTLRAGINLGNILLVTGQTADGDPEGVAPAMAAGLAAHLGLKVDLVPFASPSAVADAQAEDAWDIALIAEEPERAKTIAFCDAYVEIETTYLVPAGSPITALDQVDRPGVTVAVSERSAYDLFLSRSLQHATLHRALGLKAAFDLFVAEGHDALAGLRPALLENSTTLPGSKVLAGCFTAVRQAVGTKPRNIALQAAITDYLRQAKADGTVAALLARYGVDDKLTVAG